MESLLIAIMVKSIRAGAGAVKQHSARHPPRPPGPPLGPRAAASRGSRRAVTPAREGPLPASANTSPGGDAMRLLTFAARGQTRLGVEAGEWIIDLNRAARAHFVARGALRAAAQAWALRPPAMTAFLAGGSDAMAAARDVTARMQEALRDPRGTARLHREGVLWAPSDIERLPPVPAPPKILCVGRNYAEHAREGGSEPPELPIFFGPFPHSLLAPGAPLSQPGVSPQVDFEGELVAVIGSS